LTNTIDAYLTPTGISRLIRKGLKAAVYFLEKVEEISEEQRKTMAESLSGLIAQSEAVYGEAPARH
jgi:hypothetical protein